jgi:large repetitive protein
MNWVPLKPWLRCLYAVLATIGTCMALPACAETPGKDGDVTVSGTGVVVNSYWAVSGSAAAGSPSITTILAPTGLAVGDLVMIYQAQGATINATTTAVNYGAVTALNSAGRYEFQTVASVSGGTITFATYAGTCTGLRFGYAGTAGAQVVRVPQFRDLVVNAGNSVVASPWNGSTGGIVALTVSRNFTLNGSISANAAGFRGGAVDNAASALGITTYATTNPAEGGEKGESIAGYQATIAGGQYGRGAPANGGGGGNAHNGGGGGGANGLSGNAWVAGRGRPSTTGTGWAAAWNLEGAGMTSTTNEPGGGRGGYTFGVADGDALTQGPGNAVWGGDNRQQAGGLGGRPLTFNRLNRVYFGGGGGAGDGNNNSVGGGGKGGGLIFLQTSSTSATVTGSGIVSADGAMGANTNNSQNDAPGGGGGGGTILAQLTSAATLVFRANGGAGGNQLITSIENEGAGGGGGGGVIAVTAGLGARTANGGIHGTTGSAGVTEFPPNGATQGNTGQPAATALSRAEVPVCYAPAPTVAKTSTSYETVGINRFNIPQADVIYTITVTNPGTQIDSGSVIVTDTLPPQLTFYNGDIDDAGPLTTNYDFIDGATTSGFTSCCTLAYSAFTTGSDFTYIPAPGYDPNVKRIRYVPGGAMAPGSTTATSFQIKLRARIN